MHLTTRMRNRNWLIPRRQDHSARGVASEVPFSAINKVMNKKELSNLIDTCYRLAGNKETVIWLTA